MRTARQNRDVTEALLHSGLPNGVEDSILTALESAGVDEPVDELMGHCQRNAVALRDSLRNHDFDAIAVRGWVNDTDRHVIPRDMGEATANDAVHWWVEVQIHGAWYVFDLAANLPGERWGDLYVSTSRPSEYRPAEIEPDTMDDIREKYDLEPSRGLFDSPY